jgi:sugar (pentulose or hexulose) kinase
MSVVGCVYCGLCFAHVCSLLCVSRQIMRVASRDPAAWADCEHVSLISSAMASVFLGQFAPIDYSDGSGMNLVDINTRNWCDAWAREIVGCGGK